MMRLMLAALLSVSLNGCGSPFERIPVTPTSSTAQSPPPAPSSGLTLSGTVFESTPEGERPVAGSRVSYIAGDTVDSIVSVTADMAGRYSFSNVPRLDRLRVVAFPPPGKLSLFQRSSTATPINGDTALDIELVAGSTRGSRYGTPTLSGVIYYMAPEGPRPWTHTLVVYSAFAGPLYDVYQTTDEQGRYTFGALPLGAGHLGAGNCNDQMLFERVEIRGDTTVDFDITPLVTKCPGHPF